MCMIAVQNANLLNVQNDLLILRGSARVQQSQLLGRSLSSSCSVPSSCATQSFVHSSPPTAKSSSWLWCSCCATRWCRCWALAPPHSWRNSSWLSSPHQYSAASWGSRGAGWSLWPDRKCCSSRSLLRCAPRYLSLGTTSGAAPVCSGGRRSATLVDVQCWWRLKMALMMLIVDYQEVVTCIPEKNISLVKNK